MKILFYLQLAWHWLAYITTLVEPERLQSNLGVTYFKLGDFRRAIARLKKSERVRHSKDSSFGRYNAYYLGFSYMNLEVYRAAIAHFEEYLRFRPADAHAKEVIDWCQEQLDSNGEK
jgi:tetratricopeptide (TPR) repeat protein